MATAGGAVEAGVVVGEELPAPVDRVGAEVGGLVLHALHVHMMEGFFFHVFALALPYHMRVW